VLNYLAGCYNHKGLRQQAETALRKALQLDPGNAEAHNNLAVIYLSQNPPLVQLARWHYQKALDGGQPHNLELEKALADKGAPVTQ
jgi:Tfp pilus assembly protein PilF